jgi:hypothetical protein
MDLHSGRIVGLAFAMKADGEPGTAAGSPQPAAEPTVATPERAIQFNSPKFT